jgi:hypothetical protein
MGFWKFAYAHSLSVAGGGAFAGRVVGARGVSACPSVLFSALPDLGAAVFLRTLMVRYSFCLVAPIP